MDDQLLLLAAEDCPPEEFESIHVFLSHEERVIQALCAHGPVLIKGGRGCGKSALMIEAQRRLAKKSAESVICVYLSLRHIPLLRSQGKEYEKLLCELLSREVSRTLSSQNPESSSFPIASDITELQLRLKELSDSTNKRLVLMFDDVAHIGREASLEEFFGIFRTISGNQISCKASIYPGVTRFGIRFDIYNDATVFDLSRDERSIDYKDFFDKVLRARFSTLYDNISLQTKGLEPRDIAAFMGRTVVGNMRGFIIACGRLQNQQTTGIPALEATLKEMAADYYWPLLEELEPKLGIYQPLVETAKNLAEIIFKHAATQNKATTTIIHKDIIQKLSKTFEILEYAGFISKRESSRAMRSGGRGPRYALNLANLIEVIQPSRLTKEIFDSWMIPNPDQPSDIHASSGIIKIEQPSPIIDGDLRVFSLPINTLKKSEAYPYGLTEAKISELTAAGYTTIGEIADASDQDLRNVDGIGSRWLERIRSVVGQAVWM